VERYIRSIFCPKIGSRLANPALLARALDRVADLPGSEMEKESLANFVRLQLLGGRSRYCQCPESLNLVTFAEHARAFEAAVDESIAALAQAMEKVPSPPVFDSIIGVTSVGQVLPGIADRCRTGFQARMRRDTFLLDVGNGGCTASSRALQAAARLDARVQDCLILIVEPTSTLADAGTFERASWQGICTFGDGAAAVWVSNEPGEGALKLGEVGSWNGKEIGLIRWNYGSNYYRFGVSELSRFETNVRAELFEALRKIGWRRNETALWAVHPAGMMLLLSIAKKLGIDREALEPSIRHFREFSNMSSASIFHILREVMEKAEPGQEVRWLSMGAGFHVEYGNGVKV
jgi:alkylresorcinol/alkylpyrone synthase